MFINIVNTMMLVPVRDDEEEMDHVEAQKQRKIIQTWSDEEYMTKNEVEGRRIPRADPK